MTIGRSLRPAGLTASLAASAVLACGGCAARPPALLGIIIITLDTTRADYLGAYGSDRVMTPHLDRLAAEGVVFEQAATVAPLTLPAHSSLFTGLLPPRHGVRDNAGPLDERHQTLAEILRARGFDTAAFVGSVVLGASRGLAAGFDVYQDGLKAGRPLSAGLQRPADHVVDEAVAWLNRRTDRPFLLWAHLYDPHAPYDPPEPFRTAYRDNPYAGEIAFADEQIGRLLDVLDQRRLLDRTAVVIAADHGESLNEHGEIGHGFFIYESSTRTPFVIRAPFPRTNARRVTDPVRSVDLAPTLLDLLGLPALPGRTAGTSLVPLMTGDSVELNLDGYAEAMYPLHHYGWSALRALRAGRFKLIDAPRPELYDLDADVSESKDVAAANPEVVKKLLVFADAARDDLGDSLTKKAGKGTREPGRMPNQKKN